MTIDTFFLKHFLSGLLIGFEWVFYGLGVVCAFALVYGAIRILWWLEKKIVFCVIDWCKRLCRGFCFGWRELKLYYKREQERDRKQREES